MIIYCAADTVYFELYYNLWIGQLKKYYPEYDKLIALYKPTEETIDRCKKDNVETIDVSDSLPENPTRNHFYLLRWINLPYQKNKLILETQINCIARKKQPLPTTINVEQWRVQRPKRDILGGVSAAIFTPESAEKVVQQAEIMLDNPPDTDHQMNMWQINNLTQQQVKCEYQLREKDMKEEKSELPEWAYWLTARSAAVWSHEKKLEALTRYL
jgi:hypothetical protein|tara:strand:+ start:3594 stop:4235 length:642 start_codon:yes stop_codon:yes gene_type:complete